MLKKHRLITYLSTRLIGTVLGTALLLTTVMEALTLLEQMTPILERHLGTMGIVHYMGMRLPLLFGSILPLSMLIGSIIMLTQFTINTETTILRSAGLSTFGLIKKLLPATLLLGCTCFVFYDQIIPRSELNLAIWWNKNNPTPEKNKEFYFYRGLDIINVNHIAYGGNEIVGLTVYKRKDSAHIDSILTADRAQYKDKKWFLENAKILKVAPGVPLEFSDITKPDELVWEISLTPRQLVQLYTPSLPQSLQELYTQSTQPEKPFRLPTNTITTGIWERIFLPFTFVVMLIIAIPVTYIPPRTGLKSWLPIYCLGTGLFFIIFQEVLRALGKAGTLPAPVAVIPPLSIFILAACAIILMIEEKP